MAHLKTALVLSGGGSLGAVQVGMLQALSRIDLPVDMVIGSSVGALNGACFAEDPTPAGIERLLAIWRGLRRKDVFPVTVLAGLKALLTGGSHLVENAALKKLVHNALRVGRIEQTRIPLHIVATDVLSGQAVILSHGDIEPALLASTAIPVVFPPIELDGRFLVDGGVANNTPITSAIALGAERVLVLPTGMSCALREPPRHMPALALHVMGLQSMRQLDRDLEKHSQQAQIVVVPPLCPLDVSVLDFSRTMTLIARAAAQTRDWIAAGGLDRAGPLHVPLAHHDHPRRHEAIAAAT